MLIGPDPTLVDTHQRVRHGVQRFEECFLAGYAQLPSIRCAMGFPM